MLRVLPLQHKHLGLQHQPLAFFLRCLVLSFLNFPFFPAEPPLHTFLWRFQSFILRCCLAVHVDRQHYLLPAVSVLVQKL
jgi:hypothetical protein